MGAELDLDGQPRDRAFNAARLSDRAIDELVGLCRGLIADGNFSAEEARYLLSWLERNREHANHFPGDVIYQRVHAALVDHALSAAEQSDLLELLRQVTGDNVSIEERVAVYAASLPLNRPPPQVVFDGRGFVMTGKFVLGSREWCHEAVRARGGLTQTSPSKKTHYLVIGSIGSTEWLHSTHGRKIEAGVRLRQRGGDIAIISEEHWKGFLDATAAGTAT